MARILTRYIQGRFFRGEKRLIPLSDGYLAYDEQVYVVSDFPVGRSLMDTIDLDENHGVKPLCPIEQTCLAGHTFDDSNYSAHSHANPMDLSNAGINRWGTASGKPYTSPAQAKIYTNLEECPDVKGNFGS